MKEVAKTMEDYGYIKAPTVEQWVKVIDQYNISEETVRKSNQIHPINSS